MIYSSVFSFLFSLNVNGLSRAHVGGLTFMFKFKLLQNTIFFYSVQNCTLNCAQVCIYIYIGIRLKHKKIETKINII